MVPSWDQQKYPQNYSHGLRITPRPHISRYPILHELTTWPIQNLSKSMEGHFLNPRPVLEIPSQFGPYLVDFSACVPRPCFQFMQYILSSKDRCAVCSNSLGKLNIGTQYFSQRVEFCTNLQQSQTNGRVENCQISCCPSEETRTTCI